MAPLSVKTTDSKGRLTLGAEFAGKQFIMVRKEGNVLQMIPAETVPTREAWLYKNPKALSAVLEGLDQAKAGELFEGPDLDAALELADKIGD